ncbi:MAG: hypothetical protein MJZ34_06685 [Paludibacteraceae bacterium]|nr:hypothetical protein [Paludibacteraceae bacterium]
MDQTTTFNLSSFLSDSFVDDLFEKCVGQLSGITEICFLLCGLFAFAYFANILMKTWAKGEPIDFHALLKPFVIGIITINFSLVYNFIDAIFEPINSYTYTISTNGTEESLNAKKELSKIKKSFQDAEKEKKNENGFWKGILGINSVSSFFDNLYINAIDLLLNGLEYISAIAFGAVKLTIRAINIAFRIILIIFGPFAFALSVLPMFKKNWQSWVSKYINVCLFIPIANLMDVIIMQLNTTLMQQHIGIYRQALSNLSTDVTSIDSSLTTITVSYIIFLLAFIVLYLMIPSISSYIVSAGGMESITGGITLAGSAAASKLISGAAPNPLTPNILRLFSKLKRKHRFFEWINTTNTSVPQNLVSNQSLKAKETC